MDLRIAVPPLKCQGIKTHLVEWILEHASLAEGGTWIEPFMGSGVVGFNVRPPKAIFADVNPHIINLYNAIKNEQITPGIAKDFVTTYPHPAPLPKGEGNGYKKRIFMPKTTISSEISPLSHRDCEACRRQGVGG